MSGAKMRDFWDARAREEPYFFIDDRREYRDPDIRGFWAAGARDLEQLLSLAGTRIEPGDVVLDIGCGVGRLTRPIAERAARVYGLDVSPEMLELARTHNADHDNIEWVLGDGLSLAPLTDASVDVCLSHVVFQHIPDPAVTLGYVHEMGRVLRPDGWSLFQVSDDPAVHRREPRGSRKLLARIRRRPRGREEPAWLGSAVDLGELRHAGAAAGLRIEQVLGEGTQFCVILARRGRPSAAELG